MSLADFALRVLGFCIDGGLETEMVWKLSDSCEYWAMQFVILQNVSKD